VVRRHPTHYARRGTAAWFRDTRARHEGRVRADGVEKDVTFEDADCGIDDQLDAAYRSKYRRYAEYIIRSTTSAEARSTTLRLVPRARDTGGPS
jgi:hypothetical protein